MADYSVEELDQMERSIKSGNKGVVRTEDFVDPEELYKELIQKDNQWRVK